MQIDPNVLLCHGIMRHGCGLPVCCGLGVVKTVGLPATRRKPTANTDATNCSSKGLGAGAFALALVWWWAYPMAQGACTSLAC